MTRQFKGESLYNVRASEQYSSYYGEHRSRVKASLIISTLERFYVFFQVYGSFFPIKTHRGLDPRNSILMTCFIENPCSVSDWLLITRENSNQPMIDTDFCRATSRGKFRPVFSGGRIESWYGGVK